MHFNKLIKSNTIVQYMKATLLFLFILLAYTQALTFGEIKGIFFNIDKRRYKEVFDRVKYALKDALKTTLLKTIAVNYCMTWEQAWNLLENYSTNEEKVNGFEALNNNINDPKNRPANIAEKFPEGELRDKVTDLVSKSKECKAKEDAPDQFPSSSFYFKELWMDTEVDMIVNNIRKIPINELRMELLSRILSPNANGFTYPQIVKLYDVLNTSGEKTILIESIEDKILRITCEQVNVLQKGLLHDSRRQTALDALKSSITDYENMFILLDAFSSDNAKELARVSLENVKINENTLNNKLRTFWTVYIIIVVVVSIWVGFACYKKYKECIRDKTYMRLEVNNGNNNSLMERKSVYVL